MYLSRMMSLLRKRGECRTISMRTSHLLFKHNFVSVTNGLIASRKGTGFEFMLRLQVTDAKLQNGTELFHDERMMRRGVRQQLEISVSDYCTVFEEYS